MFRDEMVEEAQRSAGLPVKLAVLSQLLPPLPYGQTVVLWRLFKDFHPSSYCLLSDRDYRAFLASSDQSREIVPTVIPRLPGRYYHLPSRSFDCGGGPGDESAGNALRADGRNAPASSPVKTARSRLLHWFKAKAPHGLVNRLAKIRMLAREVPGSFRRVGNAAWVVQREGCGALLACTGDPFDLPAGYLAARLSGVPFYVYIMDDYLYQWKPFPFYRFAARVAEPICIRGAAGVVVLNEFVRDEYRRRYPGLVPTVVRTAFEVPELANGEKSAGPSQTNSLRIVYTGTVYHAHYDAFRNLLAAIRRLSEADVKLHLYTTQTREELEKVGIGGRDVVLHEPVASAEVFGIQRGADVLFLPLAFDSPIPEVIKTSCPMKTGEYLASGQPILVHAPSGSFLDWYFKRHECGVVVDRKDPEVLADAIKRILDDAELRENIGRNARERAEADFDLSVAREAFVKVFASGVKG